MLIIFQGGLSLTHKRNKDKRWKEGAVNKDLPGEELKGKGKKKIKSNVYISMKNCLN